jgi:hypothetical protein
MQILKAGTLYFEMRYSGMSGYTIWLLMSVRRLAMPRMITLNTVNPILL